MTGWILSAVDRPSLDCQQPVRWLSSTNQQYANRFQLLAFSRSIYTPHIINFSLWIPFVWIFPFITRFFIDYLWTISTWVLSQSYHTTRLLGGGKKPENTEGIWTYSETSYGVLRYPGAIMRQCYLLNQPTITENLAPIAKSHPVSCASSKGQN